MKSTRTLALTALLGLAAVSMAGIPGRTNGTLTSSGTAWRNYLTPTSFCWAFDDKFLSLTNQGYNPEEGQNHQVACLNFYNRANTFATTGTLMADAALTLIYNVPTGPAISATFNVHGDYDNATNCWRFTIPTNTRSFVSGNRTYTVQLTGIGSVGQTASDLCAPAPGQTLTQCIYAQINSTPEPGTMAALGLGGLALIRRKKK